MKKYAIPVGALVLVIIVAGFWAVGIRKAQAPTENGGNTTSTTTTSTTTTSTTTTTTPPNNGKACTMEAKLCPDGSAVGRTGPNCEFTPCPTTTILPYNSGVRGQVSLGPTCPVERIPPDPACAEKPYATAIVVYRTNSTTPFTMGNSDASGAFKFSLTPGSYTLKAAGGTMLPRCNPVEVTVGATGYATTTISCDTGIR